MSRPTQYSDITGPRWTRFPIRVRPHRNPLSDTLAYHPTCPEDVDWCEMYPQLNESTKDKIMSKREDNTVRLQCPIDWLDVGSAYGGMLCALGPSYPQKYILGMEIRKKVVEFAKSRVLEERKNESLLHNVWFLEANVMRSLAFWIPKQQLECIFFCYPDPHFKQHNVRRRILSDSLIPEYAYVLRPNGRLYTVTDVEELHEWMVERLSHFPDLFRRLGEEHCTADPLLTTLVHSSEDAKRSQRRGAVKHFAVYERYE
mmetsp:Transcript_1894/g.2570  ORF Transcript_1894/g.2570 Transcript_1894/m.2570 type:complete len:258 (+) Transcript_1894:82-855(+)